MTGAIVLPTNKAVYWCSAANDTSLGAHIYSPKSQQLYIGASNESSYFVFCGVRDSMWTLSAHATGNISLGTSNYKWNTVYAASGTINTSDRNEKHDIAPLDGDLWERFLMGLEAVSYKLNDGTSGRTHHGMIAQDVEDLMGDLGIDSRDFAGFIKYQKTIQQEKTRTVIGDDGNPKEERYFEEVPAIDANGDPVYGYGLRYDEFIPMLISEVQRLKKEKDRIKDELDELRTELNELKTELQDKN